ncbi:MAG: ABC transporter permease [Clostridia bacterium]|nr:ABC transporter permease [Clostridia bacterium]MBQ4621020.1 ABC transporter permease [Clostridia bacterium]MBQ9856522.1 ABC transporter permease [Clostridia bacterium]
MLKYSLKRLISAIFTLIIILSIVFFLLRQMPIEGYFDNFDKMSETTINSKLREMGLLDPFPVQLKNFFSDLLRGDLGTSAKYRVGEDVTKIILEKAPISLKMGLLSMGIALLIGIPLGGAMARSKIWDRFGTIFIVFVNAVPSAIYYIFIQMYGTQLMGISMTFEPDNLVTWILPVFSMSLGNIAYYAMWLRRYMVDEMTRDYVKLARAKGVSKKNITMKHVFRNAFVPMIQYLPSSILYTVCGSLYIESLYGIPGMGGLLVDVIGRQDNPMVQALVMIYSCIGIVGLLIGDLMMGVIDPRISFAKKEGSR